MSDQSNDNWQSDRKWITKAIAALEDAQKKNDECVEHLLKFDSRLEALVEQAKGMILTQEKLIGRLEKIETFQTKVMTIFITVQVLFGIVLALIKLKP